MLNSFDITLPRFGFQIGPETIVSLLDSRGNATPPNGSETLWQIYQSAPSRICGSIHSSNLWKPYLKIFTEIL